MKAGQLAAFVAVFTLLVADIILAGPGAKNSPEPPGWYAGDPHVHVDCGVGSGHDPMTDLQMLAEMKDRGLAVVSLLADMGNGEVRFAEKDLPKVNGKDFTGSDAQHILHWDAEWHFDPKGVTFDQKVIGGHLIVLGLKRASRMYEDYTYPIIESAKKAGAIVGYAHMQYLPEGMPEELSCCLPLEYPVETALRTIDFLMEDVDGSETAMLAYYRLLNCGFRPGLAAGTDFPCNFRKPIGSLLTYVSLPDGRPNYRGWIEGIAHGRTVVSRNGHEEFLDLRVNDTAGPGDEIRLGGGGTVRVSVAWSAVKNLSGTVELVRNGKVVASRQGSAGPGSRLVLTTSQDFAQSGWLCGRRMDARGHQTHTAAIFVTVGQAPVRAGAGDAEFFVRYIDNLILKTSPGGEWNQYFGQDLGAVQGRYRKAREIFQKIADERRAASPRAEGGSQVLPPDGRERRSETSGDRSSLILEETMKGTRRVFLKSSLGAQAAAIGLPMFVTRSLRGASAPGNLINTGVIGTGRISREHDMPGILKHEKLARITAVCDLDSNRLEEGRQFVQECCAARGISLTVRT